MKIHLLLLIAICFTVTHCGKSSEQPSKVVTEGTNAAVEPAKAAAIEEKAAPVENPFGAYDSEEEIKFLQGSWKRKSGDVWKVEGKHVAITSNDKIFPGELDASVPGQLGVAQKYDDSISTEFHGYARNGDDVYIGMGKTGVVRDGLYMVADSGVVVYDGKTCVSYKKDLFTKKFKKNKEVICSVSEDGKTFYYQTPGFLANDPPKDKTIEIVGNALLDDQSKGNKLEKL